jgi:hypothetical protein
MVHIGFLGHFLVSMMHWETIRAAVACTVHAREQVLPALIIHPRMSLLDTFVEEHLRVH